MNTRATNGASADPDTLTGIKEAKRHERATLNYLEARDALRLSGARRTGCHFGLYRRRIARRHQ